MATLDEHWSTFFDALGWVCAAQFEQSDEARAYLLPLLEEVIGVLVSEETLRVVRLADEHAQSEPGAARLGGYCGEQMQYFVARTSRARRGGGPADDSRRMLEAGTVVKDGAGHFVQKLAGLPVWLENAFREIDTLVALAKSV